jgi:hypothetical protein
MCVRRVSAVQAVCVKEQEYKVQKLGSNNKGTRGRQAWGRAGQGMREDIRVVHGAVSAMSMGVTPRACFCFHHQHQH